MFGRKISLDSELYEQLKKCAESGGYATPEEFARHVLEKEVDRLRGGASETAAVEAGPPVEAAEPPPEQPQEPESTEAAVVESSAPEQPSEPPA